MTAKKKAKTPSREEILRARARADSDAFESAYGRNGTKVRKKKTTKKK